MNRDEMTRWIQQEQVPAVGIAFIENGVIKQTEVFGELENGVPAPLNTIWNVASLTKPVTALVALLLIDKGEWNLDEPVARYYTDPDLAGHPYAQKLTTRMILSHQTGFPNWRYLNPDGKLGFDFEPGTGYQYSGEGYEYLRNALEQKFGKTLDQLADALIFQPLNMTDTHFFWGPQVDEKRFAKWHNSTGERYPTNKTTSANGADDLLTTVEEYAAFMVWVLSGAGLSERLQQELTADQVRVNASKHFGLGWCIDEKINENNDFALVHGGNDIGVNTIAFLIPKTKNGLLIFTNSDNGTAVFETLLVQFLGQDGAGILRVEMQE